jgi:acetyl-CoA synthetase (ADP-forming)
VVGASEDLGKFGGRVLHHLIKHRFQGRIVPVNPNRPDLFGLNAPRQQWPRSGQSTWR